MIPTTFSRDFNDRLYFLLNTRQMILLKETQNIHDNKDRVACFCATLKSFRGENPTLQLALCANLKKAFDNCSVCDGKPIRAFTYILSDNATEMCEAYTAHGINIGTPG